MAGLEEGMEKEFARLAAEAARLVSDVAVQRRTEIQRRLEPKAE